jgi:branched-chain amino acid transport system permease protein
MKGLRFAGAGIGIMALFFMPLYLSAYWTSLLFTLLINIALAGGINLLWGYAGYLNLGYVTFFGLGAYGTAVFLLQGYSFGSALLIGLLLFLPLTLLSAGLLLHLGGHYFSVASLGILIFFEKLAGKLVFLSGGLEGLSLPLGNHLKESYWLGLVLAGASIGLNMVIHTHKLGYQLKIIQEDESMAEAVGISLFSAKGKAYLLGVVIAFLAGGITVYQSGYVSPASAFGLSAAMPPVIMALIGGGTRWWGPVGGALLVTILHELVWTGSGRWVLSWYGLALIAFGIGRAQLDTRRKVGLSRASN